MDAHHASHELVEDPPNGFSCANCWGCPCHSPDILREPCTNDMTVAPMSLVKTKRKKAL